MEAKVIAFSIGTVWDWIIQFMSLGLFIFIVALVTGVLILLIKKLKKLVR